MRLLLDVNPFQSREGQPHPDEQLFTDLAEQATDATNPYTLAVSMNPADEQQTRALVAKLQKVGVRDSAFGFYKNQTADIATADQQNPAPTDQTQWQRLRSIVVTAHYRSRAPQAICIPAAVWEPTATGASTPLFEALPGLVCSVVVSNGDIVDALEKAGTLDAFITTISQSDFVFANGNKLAKRLAKAGIPNAKLQTYAPDEKGSDILAALQEAVERRDENRRPRIAWVSPMPPTKSGIAFFSEEVVEGLIGHADVTVFADDKSFNASTPTIRNGVDIRHYETLPDVYQNYDSVIYHIGNSPFHVHMLDMVRITGGVVVLHDLYVGHLMEAYSARTGGDLSVFTQELASAHPDIASRDDWTRETIDEAIQSNAFARPFIEAADRTVVHSFYARQKAMEFYPDLQPAEISVLRQPHTIPDLNSDAERAKARKRLGIAQDDLLVVSLGYITSQKGVAELYQACKAMQTAGTPIALHLVGVANEPWAVEFLHGIEADIASGLVHVAGFVTDEQYQDYLKAADIGVQLRTFTRGETSRAVLDLLACGVATIVTDMGDMAEYPSDVVVKLPPTNDVAALTDSINSLAASKQQRDKFGAAAQDYLRQNHSIDSYIAVMRDAVATAAQRRKARAPYETIQDALETLPDGQNTEKAVELLVSDLSFNTDIAARIARQPRLLVDITAIFHRDGLTGIQRVVRDLTYNLHKTGPVRGINPQCFRWDLDHYNTNDEFLFRRDAGSYAVPEEAELTVQPRDTVLMLDASWNVYGKFLPLFDQIEKVDGKIYTIVYDLVPKLYPELTDPTLVTIFDQWLRLAALHSHGLICISKAVADEVIHHIKTEKIAHRDGLKVGWFHLGSDLRPVADETDVRDPVVSALDGEAPTFLMVSTIEPRKRHASVLDAMERLWENGSNARLVLMGREGWHIAEVAKRLRKHRENGKRLFWFEGASDAEVTYGYNHANALVFASVYEGYGLPVTEAALADLPVICSDIPVLREIAGKGAIYFEVDNPKSIAEALQRFIDKPDVANPADVNVRTWSQSASQILDVIQNDDWLEVLK